LHAFDDLTVFSQVHADVDVIEEKLRQMRDTVKNNQTTAAGSRCASEFPISSCSN
jgi:hypothetical protein